MPAQTAKLLTTPTEKQARSVSEPWLDATAGSIAWPSFVGARVLLLLLLPSLVLQLGLPLLLLLLPLFFLSSQPSPPQMGAAVVLLVASDSSWNPAP